MWSYWRHTQLVSASMASEVGAGIAASAGRARGRVDLAAAVTAAPGPVVERGGVVQRRRRHVGQHRAVAAEDAQPPAVGHPPDDGGPHLPPVADGEPPRRGRRARRWPASAPGSRDVMTSNGSMPGSRRGTAATSTSMPMPARLAVSLVAHGQPGAAEVLDADDEAGVEQGQARLDEPLLLERIADLHARPLGLVGAVAEPGAGQHAHAADAVAPGGRAEQHGQVALAAGLAEHEPVGGQHAEAQHVHERVAAVGLVEHDLAADRRHADGVAVAGDAATRRLRRSSGCGRRRADRSAAGP